MGGLGVMGVAAFPVPSADGSSSAHLVAAGVAFGALATWPVFSTPGGISALPWALRPAVARGAGAVLLATLGWFVLELAADSSRVGLSERFAAGSQVLWPLVAVLSARRAGR
jgi:hypothetical protein